jgi:multiple sugar transport system ATP-binding protein
MGSPPMSFAPLTASGDGRSLTMPSGVVLPARAGLSAGKAYDAGFRPEHVKLGADAFAGAVNTTARVEILEPLGAETLALLSIGGAMLTGRFPPQAGVRTGDEVTVSLGAAEMHLFDTETGRALAA